jgi:hypothetical protein
MGIYQAIQEEFRENIGMDPSDEKTKTKVEMAYKGLTQLHLFDEMEMTGGKLSDPNWKPSTEQSPLPSPPNYKQK